jgi:hypothetical protein
MLGHTLLHANTRAKHLPMCIASDVTYAPTYHMIHRMYHTSHCWLQSLNAGLSLSAQICIQVLQPNTPIWHVPHNKSLMGSSWPVPPDAASIAAAPALPRYLHSGVMTVTNVAFFQCRFESHNWQTSSTAALAMAAQSSTPALAMASVITLMIAW